MTHTDRIMRNVLTIAVLVATGVVSAGEKKLMHCFVFTIIEEATQSDWDAFAKATDELPKKIPGLTRVWHGKLRAPLNIVTTDSETGKKLAAGGKDVTGPMNRLQRKHGVCMEMDGPEALTVYAKHPAHTEWQAVYSKVLVAGSTTFDILGQ